MITLLNAPTPNGRKAFIMLEETGLPYRTKAVDFSKNEQTSPEFLAVSPNNKIPAIIDEDAPGGPLALFESGAILTYLADKSGKFLAASGPARYQAMAWNYWAASGIGPMLGQLGFWARQEDKNLPAVERYTTECTRLIKVLESRLNEARYLAGDDYTIADINAYTWTWAAANMMRAMAPTIWGDGTPAIDRWLAEVGERPAVQRAMATPPPTGAG